MEKQTKISCWLFSLVLLLSILHNAVFGLFRIEEPVFFILALMFAFGFAVSVIYNTATYIKKGRPRDLWKIGFIGLFGLIGLWPKFGAGFYGFFAFFAFFGLKK